MKQKKESSNFTRSLRALWIGLGFLILTLTSNASAMKCSGNVWLKVPASWPGVYIVVDGSFTAIPATSIVNGWYKFQLNTYGGQYADNYFFLSVNNGWNSNGISRVTYDAAVNQNDKFTCADFGGQTDVYISQDLSSPAKTYISNVPPNAKYFYFVPPDDADWFQGNAMMIVNGGTPVKMTPDPVRCGYYQAVYFNVDPDTNVLLTSDVDPTNMVLGLNGTADVVPVSINLKKQFDTYAPSGSNLYFSADDGSWSSADPLVTRQCSYNLAAIIYDQDAALHGAFSCDAYPNIGTSSCASAVTYYDPSTGKIPCLGVTPNMVMPTLGSNRMPIYNPASKCMKDSTMYNTMFRETAQSVKTCYDLPFTRNTAGLWEFDSYNTPSKAFYPVDNQPNSGPGLQRAAMAGVPYGNGAGTLATDVVNAQAAVQFAAYPKIDWSAKDSATGQMLIDLYPATSGEFSSGTNPNVYDNTGWNVAAGSHNQLFCFESHANFIYHPGQTFYFRGDDDIWVFINNKLSVDLGGMHLAAPSHVKLDTMGLTSGAPYPIDIFFCDRRTNMSDIRISTNMFFSQKTSLYYDQTGGTYVLNKVASNATGSCAALTNNTTAIIPGSQITDLQYMLLSTKGDTIDGDPSTPAVDTYLVTGKTVYGGIAINNGTVTLDTAHLSGLPPGRYKLTIFESSAPGVKVTITFRIAGTTAFWSANGQTSLTAMTKNPVVDTLVGRLVQFQVANKSGDFVDSTNAAFQLSFPPELLVYSDSLGTQQVQNLQLDSTGSKGLATFWATGTKKAADTATYQVVLKGSKSAPINLKFHQPRLEFVTDSLSTTALLNPKPAFGGDTLNFAYINFPTYLLAYDPVGGAPCTDCTDTLTAATTDSLAFSAPDGGIVLRLVNGRAEVLVRGTNKVTNGAFTVTGSSALMTAAWSPINLDLPPVPVPKDAGMYDKDGNGIADSLHILFDRSIMANDSTPDSLIVRWPSTAPDTTRIHGKDSVRMYLSDANTGLSIPYSYSQVNTSGVGNADIWFTFTKNGKTIHSALSETIADRMGPIVRYARIRISKTASTVSNTTFDTLLVALSEPVDTVGIGAAGIPFEFVVISTANGLTPHAVNTARFRWNSKLDTVRLLYDATAAHPSVGDSVRVSIFGSYILKDPQGNARSILNPLVRIEGDKRIEVVSVPITGFDPTDPLVEKRKTQPATFVQKVSMSSPLDTVKANLSAKLGPVLGYEVKIDLYDQFANSQSTYAKQNKGLQLQPKDVVLHYRLDIYTSLGGYVVEGKGSVSCVDTTVFGKGGCTGPDNGYIFLGWNLTSDKGRLVGSGAYVARLETWVTVETLGKVATVNSNQTWGVVRTKGKAQLFK